MFKFKYARFHKKIIKNIDDDSHFTGMGEMDVLIYDALEKYDAKSVQFAKFSITDIANVRRVTSISDSYEDIYPYGMYVVPDYKDWLIFVFPMDYDDKYVANHYSILLNKRKVNFHLTDYIAKKEDDIHMYDDFNDGIELPLEGFDDLKILKTFTKQRGLFRHKESVIDILRLPWKHNFEGDYTLGSTSKQHKRSRYNKAVLNLVQKDIQLNKRFDAYNIETMLVFSFHHGSMYHYSCHVYDTHHWEDRDKTQSRIALSFTSKSKLDEKSIRQKIKNVLRK